jgi:tRNA(fMet)-specific endonuclease VapC
MAALCISAITEGELLFGLAKRPDAKRLHVVVQEFLRRVDVLPWDSTVTPHYGTVRAELERRGKTLAPLDLLIATHALSVGAVLVTNDQAFYQMAGLSVEDWTV